MWFARIAGYNTKTGEAGGGDCAYPTDKYAYCCNNFADRNGYDVVYYGLHTSCGCQESHVYFKVLNPQTGERIRVKLEEVPEPVREII